MIRPRFSRCRTCGASIIWAVTEHGRKIPVDAKPIAEGNLVLDEDCFDGLRARHVRDVEGAFEERYMTHFATCAQASKWRRGT